MQTLNSAIRWWAKSRPDTIAVSVADESMTYQTYDAWSERIAAKLIADGVNVGDRIAICSANSLEYCALILGIIRAGAIVLPLNIRFTQHELEEILHDTTPKLIFTDSERAAKFTGAAVPHDEISTLGALRDGACANVDRQLEPDFPVVIISTSGSTAKPKGVVLSHRTITNYAAGFALEEGDISAGSRIILVAPLSTSAGFVQLIHYAIMGCSMYMEPKFDAERFLSIIVEKKVNGFGAVPLFFERIAACPGFADADISSLHVATTGGSRVSQELQSMYAQKGVVIRQIYGQTECGGNATIMPANLAEKYPEKCGRGGIFTELAIIDNEGNHLPSGAQGQIIIRGPGTMLGYWNNPEETAKVLKDGWLLTGDIGVLDDEGLLTFVDRMKDIIISGGLNISAAEIERALCDYPGVEEAAVIAASDPKFGETPLGIIYGSRSLDRRALVAHCNERLADFKVPRYLAFETEPLPRLATGKISKIILRQKYNDAANQLERIR